MKIKPISSVIIFLIAGLIYLLLLVGAMNLFYVKDSEGFFRDVDFLLLGIVYQIPLSIITTLIYAYFIKKIMKAKLTIYDIVQLNIPLLWFPLVVDRFYMLYLIKNGALIQTKDGHWIDKDTENADRNEQI